MYKIQYFACFIIGVFIFRFNFSNLNFIFSHFHCQSFLIVLLYPYVKVKLATVVEGDLKAPFLTATTPKCRRGRHDNFEQLCLSLIKAPFLAVAYVENISCLNIGT